MLECLQYKARTETIILSRHADEKRLARGISLDSIHETVRKFEVIEEYSDAYAHPAMLLVGIDVGEPIHLVAGFDLRIDRIYVITVYFPDEEHFEPDLRTRKRK